jgi:hypothetical protein
MMILSVCGSINKLCSKHTKYFSNVYEMTHLLCIKENTIRKNKKEKQAKCPLS